MSFMVIIRHPHWDGRSDWAYASCEDHQELKELRRLLKRRSRKFTVQRLDDIGRVCDHIQDLELDELRQNYTVLEAISERTSDV